MTQEGVEGVESPSPGSHGVDEDGPGRRSPAQVLLVANAYPSDRQLYRNGFIHRRVRAYLDAGISVEVFYLHPPVQEGYTYEFDGVHVIVGNEDAYAAHVATHAYRTILVHFASPAMIAPIREHRPRTPVIVWVHGFEAEAWHRRWFNFTESAAQIRTAFDKRRSYHDEQLAFLGWLISTDELDVRVVHVSDWFRRHVVEPDVRTATRRPVIIPNVIDEELFIHHPKEPEQRFHLLSVRPYASRKYANDLMVDAVLELSRRPYFGRLSFTIAGEGSLFESTTAPLQALPNVTLRHGFLRQEEIAAEHARHGVLLTPTRFDSQGVSMGEAMASGLVPVATRIAAVPEFVDHGVSGLLAEPEDPEGLADLVEQLVYDAELFAKLSANAAARVRAQCGRAATVDREIELIGVDR